MVPMVGSQWSVPAVMAGLLLSSPLTINLAGCSRLDPHISTPSVTGAPPAQATTSGEVEPPPQAPPPSDPSLPPPLTGTIGTTSGGPVRLEVLPQYNPIRGDAATELHLMVRLSTGASPTLQRPPLDLAIVLDRSGSMAGDKLRDAKQAGLDLLQQLQPTDRVTLITYDDTVVTHESLRRLDPEGVAALRKSLLAVTEGGSTALGPALFQGLEILEKAERGDKAIAHLLLLSDGLANVGEQRPEIIGARAAQGFSHGVSVSTLGVGLDYNEDLMTKVADQGGGRYHFIKDSNTITTIVREELAGLSSTVARGITLSFTAAPGVGQPYVFGYASEVKEGTTLVRVGAMRASETRELILRVPVEPGTDAAQSLAQVLGSLELKLRDVRGDGQDFSSQVTLRVGVSASSDEVAKGERTEVTIRVAEVESAEQLEQATRLVETGDYAGARSSLQNSILMMRDKATRTPSEKLKKQLVELESAASDIDQAQQSEIDRKLYMKSQKAKSYQLKK